jgi:hypothetical protein
MVNWDTVLQEIDFEEDLEKAFQSCSQLLGDPVAQEVRAILIERLCHATSTPIPFANPEEFQREMEVILTHGVPQSVQSGAISTTRLEEMLRHPNLLLMLSKIQ